MYSSAGAKRAREDAVIAQAATAPILTVFSGLMGSGKSTSARELKQQRRTAWLIARDQFRDSVFGAPDLFGAEEEAISEAMVALARLAISFGHDVIVDDLNIFPEDRQRWVALAQEMKVEIEWRNMTTPLEECIRRDSLRAAPVGRAVIEAYANAAGLLSTQSDGTAVGPCLNEALVNDN
jgi:predicted kinase